MADSQSIGIALAVGAALLLVTQDAQSFSPSEAGGLAPDVPMDDVPTYPMSQIDIDYESIDWRGYFTDVQTEAQLSALADQNVAAFLYMIRCCEHIFPENIVDDMCYWIFYGGSTFENQSDHPVITGEKKGIPLAPATCRAAGYADGICVSTAAGAYQIIVPTWKRVREKAPRLDDFTPQSQDAAAVRLLQECGAYPYILAGDVPTAILKASKLWASLPGSVAQQGPKSQQYALARFNEFNMG